MEQERETTELNQRTAARDQPTAGPVSFRETDQPAVCVSATPDNAGAVAETILRGYDNGYETIVCHGGTDELEAILFAERLDVPILDVNIHQDGGATLSEGMAREARDLGYPGVLYHSEPERPVDYAASVKKLQETDKYLIEAVSETRIDAETEVLVAVPAYNEAATISDVVRSTRRYADEVVAIDDGSTDDTVQRAREAGATVIQHEENKGYGGALSTAFTEANRCHVDTLAILDGDGQHNPGDLPKLLETQRKTDAGIVIGSRSVEGARTDMPLYRRFGFRVVNLLTNLSMGVFRPSSRVADTQSGFRVYDRAAIEMLSEKELKRDMSASTDILLYAHKEGHTIEEVGTTISYDVEDANSHTPIAHGIQLVSNLVQTIERERPLSLLGIPGFIATVIGVIFVYWTFANYLSSGTFPIGLAITSGFFGMIGAFTSLAAIMLHSLNTHASRAKHGDESETPASPRSLD